MADHKMAWCSTLAIANLSSCCHEEEIKDLTLHLMPSQRCKQQNHAQLQAPILHTTNAKVKNCGHTMANVSHCGSTACNSVLLFKGFLLNSDQNQQASLFRAVRGKNPTQASICTGLNSYHALSTKKVRNNFLIDVIQQSPRTLVVISSINKEFLSSVVINEWTNL